MQSNDSPKGSPFVLILGLLAVLFIVTRFFPLQDYLTNLLEWIRNSGRAGVFFYILFYVLATVFFLPGSVLTLGAGAIYGVPAGSLLVSFASTLGALCAFLIGRFAGRSWVSAKIRGNRKFEAMDQAVAKQGWKIVGLTRLSPVFPFNLLNYAFGLTRVSLRDYLLASWIGMMPGTVMYVYIGSVAGDLVRSASGEKSYTAAEWILYSVGFLATVVVTVMITRMARKALAEKGVA